MESKGQEICLEAQVNAQQASDMLGELAEAVRIMRLAQKQYFKSRCHVALEGALAAEKRVDALLDTIFPPVRPTYPKY